MRLDGHLDSYIDSLRYEQGRSPNTALNYRSDIRVFLDWMSASGMSVPDGHALRGWLGSLKAAKLTRKSIARKLAAVRSFLRFLERTGVMAAGIAGSVSSPKMEKHIPSFLTFDEVSGFLDSFDEDSFMVKRDHALFELFYSTGARVSELSGLRMTGVDMERSVIKVLGKGGKERILPCGQTALEHLRIWLAERPKSLAHARKPDCGRVFLNRDAEGLGTRGMDKILRKRLAAACEGAGIPKKVSLHTLRHTFATHLLNNGCDIRSVQELLGHRSLNTTQTYTHVTREKLKETYRHAHPHACSIVIAKVGSGVGTRKGTNASLGAMTDVESGVSARQDTNAVKNDEMAGHAAREL